MIKMKGDDRKNILYIHEEWTKNDVWNRWKNKYVKRIKEVKLSDEKYIRWWWNIEILKKKNANQI